MQALETDLSPEQAGFSNWQDGSDLFMALNKDGAIFDETLRPFVEECDQMQGFQIMASVDDGWSGFTAKYIEGLRDDFGKIPIWVWALGQTVSAIWKPSFHHLLGWPVGKGCQETGKSGQVATRNLITSIYLYTHDELP